MGAECLATTPNEVYSCYFQGTKVPQLKDHWSTVQVYKIKKIYDKACEKHPQYSKHTHLPFQKFKGVLPDLSQFQEIHKRRVFEIFDHDNQGFLDWNNFYSSISICYFADINTLAVLLFMIFDDHLTKELTKEQVQLLCHLNEAYIQQNIQNQDSTPMYDPDEVATELLNGTNMLGVQNWLKKCHQYFDFNRVRTLFSIFMQEKLEKKLVMNYNEWNNLYNQDEQRYISYVISYKWFESWKIYVLQAYGKTLNVQTGKATTIKTIKTKKHLKNELSLSNCNKIANTHHLRQLKVQYEERSEECSIPEQIKNYDFVHSNIGERPREIYNKVLEGEHEEVLKTGLVENSDYVLVSERVWNSLKSIYEGFPQFRRTGYDFIELYPKILKIYSQLFKGCIDYSSEIMREVSCYLTVEELLIKSIQVNKEQLQQKAVFFKTIGMNRWEQIGDLEFMFSELTPDVMIFLIYIDRTDVDMFKKNHQKVSKVILEINVGDHIIYQSLTNGIRLDKNAIFMGKNTEGKYVLHFPGESYIYDIAIMEEQLYKKCTVAGGKSSIEDIKLKKKSELDGIGIANTKGIGFVNSVILHLFANRAFRENISFVNCTNGQVNKIVQVLSHVNSLISSKKKVDPRDIIDMIQIMLSDFQNFEIGMCYSFLNEFLSKIQIEMASLLMKDIINDEFKIVIKKDIKCGKCNTKNQLQEESKFISLPIPENSEKYFEIIYVPYCQNFKSLQIKRHGFTLTRDATFKQYKETFEKLAEVTSQTYILAQVYNNNIIKNYSTAKNNATLAQLHLRDTDTIYAFELCVNFERFIAEHYTAIKDITSKDFKVDQFIDCKNEERGWIFGKISEIEFLPYTHRTIFRVIHKFSKNQQWEISYDLYQGGISNFPTRSYLNAQQYHIRLLQRYFNEPSNQMQLCNIPLVVVLTNWMRWKEFYYLIYLQVKRFINDDHRFKDDQQEENVNIYSSKTLDNNGGKSPRNKNQTKKIKLNKFKQYLYGNDFPFNINFVDRDGRCAICFKFLKTKVLKGQSESYCEGCALSHSEPISWQIRASDVMICIDWKDISKMKKNAVKDHSSYANLLTSKKNDMENLQNCVNAKLTNPYSEQVETLCCNIPILSQIREQVVRNPETLTIYLERVIEQDGFKRVVNKHVNFEMDHFQFNRETYKLIGLTGIQGGNKNVQYKTYILNTDGEWLQYDGELVRIVKKNIVQKVCAFVLYYRKKNIKQTKQDKQSPKGSMNKP